MGKTRAEILQAFDSQGMDYAITQGYADDCDEPELAALIAQAREPLLKLATIFENEFLYADEEET